MNTTAVHPSIDGTPIGSEPFGVVEQSIAVVLVAIRCASPASADRHRERWQRGGCSYVVVDSSNCSGDTTVTAAFPSVFDALLAVGAVGAVGAMGAVGGGARAGVDGARASITAAHDETLAIVSGSSGPGTGGEPLEGRVAALLAAARPGQCLVGAEVGLLAGPLLAPGLDIVDSGRREKRLDRWNDPDGGGTIVYDIRPTDLAGRLNSCPRLEWARRRVHGADAVPDGEWCRRGSQTAARITSLVAADESSLEVAVARAALGAHSVGAHVLRTEGRVEGRQLLSAVVELLVAYADDRGSSLATEELAHEWAAVSRSLPEIASRVGRDARHDASVRTRYHNRGRDRLDLLDRLLRTIASTGSTVIVITGVDELDPLSRVLLERVLGDRRLPDIRLVVGSVGAESEFVARLRRRLGSEHIEQVRLAS